MGHDLAATGSDRVVEVKEKMLVRHTGMCDIKIVYRSLILPFCTLHIRPIYATIAAYAVFTV